MKQTTGKMKRGYLGYTVAELENKRQRVTRLLQVLPKGIKANNFLFSSGERAVYSGRLDGQDLSIDTNDAGTE